MGNQQDKQIQMQNETQAQDGQQKSEIEVEFLFKIVDVERRNRWIRCFKEFNINTMEELIQSYGLDKKSKVGRRCNEAEHIILNDYFLKKQKVYNVDPISKFLQTQDYLSEQLISGTALIDSKPFIIKNILIVGITGQGKTTFINSLVTYLKGFNTPNSYKTFNDRYYVAEIKTQEVKSDTQQVISYQIIYKNYIFNLIDTPGLADTQGFEADLKRISQISEYIQNNLQKQNQLLHGILIVSQSSTQYEVQDGNRTLLQMAMLNILKLFGKNMCGYTTHILSFSDFTTTNIRNFESPNSIFYALTVEQSQKFQNQQNTFQFNSASAQEFDYQKEQRSFQQYLQFQNSVFQAKEIGFIEKIQIKKNIENYDNLCRNFIESEGFPLDTTCEVIKTRENLKIQINEILQNLKSLTNASKKIQDSIKKIDIFLNKAKDSENFEYIDYVTICQRVFQEKENVYFTNCLACSKSCCNECKVTHQDIIHCNRMVKLNDTYKCNECGCLVNQHINERYKWVFKTEEVKNINNDLKSEYDKAIFLKEEAEKRKVQLENLLMQVRQEIYEGITSLKICLENLLTSALYNFDISDYEATEYIEKCYPDYKDVISEFHFKEELKIKPEVRKQQKDKIMHSMTLLGIKTIQFQDK